MSMAKMLSHILTFAMALSLGCASSNEQGAGKSPDAVTDLERTEPLNTISEVRDVIFGEPLSVSVDFEGNILVGDGAPGRVVRIEASATDALEFQDPLRSPGFYPADLAVSGFFVYVLDEVGRTLLRFDNQGAYRDVLVDFDGLLQNRLIAPGGLGVDSSGRIAVSDARNHQVILFDTYFQVEQVFGNYGSSPGQFEAPQGVSFTPNGGILVTDTGNRRIQYFDPGGRFLMSFPLRPDETPLKRPRRAVMDMQGQVYVADPLAGGVFVFGDDGRLVRSIVPQGVSRFQPHDVAVTASGLIYVADTANSSLYLFR